MRHGGICDKFAVMVMLLMLVRINHALAGEQLSIPIGPLRPDFNASRGSAPDALPSMAPAPMFDLPRAYQVVETPVSDPFSPHDFRARGRSILEREPQLAASEDVPMLRGTTVWQRLADYRSHGRVRLLTLWETGGNSVSLQAGKKGEPSLQWTSRSMNRGGATRGVFDQLASLSIAGASRGFRPAPRQSPSASSSEPGARAGKLADVSTMGANK